MFFLRDKLKGLSDSDEVPFRTREEVQLIVDFIHSKEGLKDTLSRYQELVPCPIRKMTFDMLWTLFPPHELVYCPSPSFETMERCYRIEYTAPAIGVEGPLLFVSLVYGNRDGKKFGIMRHKVHLQEFYGVVDITKANLPLIPFNFLTDLEQMEIRSRVIERGKKLVELQSKKFSFMAYKGPLWLSRSDDEKLLKPLGEPVGWEVSHSLGLLIT